MKPSAVDEGTRLSHSFSASRWTRGNFLFPTKIVVTPQHVLRVKPRLAGSDEESISIDKVASVHISSGMIWSEIRIDSSGGVQPIISHGHTKGDAQKIRELIERYQSGGGTMIIPPMKKD